MDKIYKKFFIYNTVTGNCLSDKLYHNTVPNSEKLYKDLKNFQQLKPTATMGEAIFDKSTHRLLEQVPADVTGVNYPEDAMAQEVFSAKQSA